MNKQEYRKILSRLPIQNPTPEDMAQLCPHLTQEQAVEAFHNQERSSYVACPPLRIRGAFQIVSFYGEWVHSQTGETHPPQLSYSYAGRTPQSYSDGQAHGDVFHEYQYASEAIKFAEDNWGDDLILDTWESVVEIYVQDPSELTLGIGLYGNSCGGYPTTKAVLGICLNRELNVIINEYHKPQSVLFDEAIIEMTLDPVVWHELKGGRGGYIEFNCAYCGSGLGLCGCSGCGHRFDDDQYRCGWNTPLSQKMIKILQASGHVFKKDPQIALKTEAGYHKKILQANAEK
jgi:hypothetical protein